MPMPDTIKWSSSSLFYRRTRLDITNRWSRAPKFVQPLSVQPPTTQCIVGAEIAGRSMPDEHTCVGPPKTPLPPQYPIPNACCMNVMRLWYTCDVCFTWCMYNSSIGEVFCFYNLTSLDSSDQLERLTDPLLVPPPKSPLQYPIPYLCVLYESDTRIGEVFCFYNLTSVHSLNKKSLFNDWIFSQ